MIEPRLLEPQLPEPGKPVASAPSAVPVRLLDTLARGHIGRPVLHRQSNGELTQDPVWRWASAPDRYLDTALRIELTSNPQIRLVESSGFTVAATLLVWALESEGETRLVGAVEFKLTGADRVVHTHVARASELVSADLPGNLAAASGSLLRRLVAEGVSRLTQS
jgi:hypothetical protein